MRPSKQARELNKRIKRGMASRHQMSPQMRIGTVVARNTTDLTVDVQLAEMIGTSESVTCVCVGFGVASANMPAVNDVVVLLHLSTAPPICIGVIP